MRRNHILRTSVALAAATALLGACSESRADTDDKADESPSSSSPTVNEETSAPAEKSSAPTEGDALPDGVPPLPGPDPGVECATLPAGRYRVPLNDTLAFDVDVADETSAHDDGLFLASGPVILKTEVAGEA